MMDMIEILYNQYSTNTKLYVTWDAVAWHNSGPFLEALDQFNEETRALSVGPVIELVPLPTSSQFLNVIEGVLSGMTRAVINNSDYPDAARALATGEDGILTGLGDVHAELTIPSSVTAVAAVRAKRSLCSRLTMDTSGTACAMRTAPRRGVEMRRVSGKMKAWG